MSKLNSAFITGAGGFIGRHLVRKLLQQAVEVTALMLPEEEVPAEWGEQVSIVIGDIRALKQATAALAPADCIFHLAAIVSDWGARQEHVDVTVGGTEQAIELALQWDAHFLVTTSVAAYASALAQGRLSESAELGKPSPHSEFCKQAQERVTLEAVQKRGLKATIVRPGNVFGVGSGPWMHTMLELINAGKPTLLGSGEWDAGLCHVNNLADLLILAARSDCTAGDIFNGADGFGVTWKTYLTRLAEVAGAPPPTSAPNWFVKIAAIAFETWANWRNQEERPMVTRLSYRLTGGPNVFDISAAKNRLGYQPAVNFEDAMAELAAHFGFSAATENPWVWVTGSASGLGRHLTGQLLQRGYRVLATDLDFLSFFPFILSFLSFLSFLSLPIFLSFLAFLSALSFLSLPSFFLNPFFPSLDFFFLPLFDVFIPVGSFGSLGPFGGSTSPGVPVVGGRKGKVGSTGATGSAGASAATSSDDVFFLLPLVPWEDLDFAFDEDLPPLPPFAPLS